MQTARVLIVEDELAIALDLEILIIEFVSAEVIIKSSVASAREVLIETIDFAFLDINVTDGKTLGLAEILSRKGVPFAFISSSSPEDLPISLRDVPFLPKPFERGKIGQVLEANLN
jgi:two-component SAPR family response regulator